MKLLTKKAQTIYITISIRFKEKKITLENYEHKPKKYWSQTNKEKERKKSQ